MFAACDSPPSSLLQLPGARKSQGPETTEALDATGSHRQASRKDHISPETLAAENGAGLSLGARSSQQARTYALAPIRPTENLRTLPCKRLARLHLVRLDS